MERIKWGIIGCGDVTEIKSGPAFNKVPNSELVAVMRRNEEKVKDYASRHNVPKWYTNAADLINDEEVNAIYVATPPSSHEEYALMAIAAGKPVYLEKPMTKDAAAAQRIAGLVKEKGSKLCIAHYRRQQPLFLKVKSLLEQNAIGKIHTAQLKLLLPHKTLSASQKEEPWRLNPAVSGGGLFHDLSPHQLDLMFFFLGKPVQAKGISANTGGFYSADDTVSGTILLENNVLFNGAWCFVVPSFMKKDECLIVGADGAIRFSIFEPAPVVLTKKEGEQIFHFDPLPHVQQPMIEQVVRYFIGERDNPCSAEEGVTVMKLIDSLTGKGSF